MSNEFPLVWDLDSLLPAPNTPEFRSRVDDFRTRLTALAEQSDRLPPFQLDAAAVWGDFIERYEALDAEATDLHAFIDCHSSADAENKLCLQLKAELSALTPLRERLATTLEFAVRDVAPAVFEATVAAAPALASRRYFLQLKQRQAAFRLPKDQELLAADLAVDGFHAWGRFYDRISGALKVHVVERGKPVVKSPGQILFDSPQRTVRENNFLAADAAWTTIEDSCADALNHLAGTRLTLYKRLGLRDHLEVPLLANRMSRATLDAMWGTISDRKSVLQRYLSTKARLLGLEKLAWFDLTAPLPGIPGAGRADHIPYDQACHWIIEAFQQFSPELGRFAEMTLRDRWIEAENRSGKRQGGFCTTLPTFHQSRIFMTYTNSADSMSTLAHEIGHAYHSWVLRDAPVFLADYPMNLAETASTFAEAVLNAELLTQARTDYERLGILDNLLSDAVAFLMNIHARFLFEDEFHRARAQGELTAADFNGLMVTAQKRAYLDSLAEDGWNPRFWASKLHFYITGTPFYNFPYTFGYLLSLGLYAIGRDAGPGFPDQYRRLLIATGNMDAEDAVQSTLGFDLRNDSFWSRSLNLIADLVTEYETIATRLLEKTGTL